MDNTKVLQAIIKLTQLATEFGIMAVTCDSHNGIEAKIVTRKYLEEGVTWLTETVNVISKEFVDAIDEVASRDIQVDIYTYIECCTACGEKHGSVCMGTNSYTGVKSYLCSTLATMVQLAPMGDKEKILAARGENIEEHNA